MELDAQDQPQYLGQRKAGIAAWFSESIHEMHTLDLGQPHSAWAAYRNP
jgi:hypothetical protein